MSQLRSSSERPKPALLVPGLTIVISVTILTGVLLLLIIIVIIIIIRTYCYLHDLSLRLLPSIFKIMMIIIMVIRTIQLFKFQHRYMSLYCYYDYCCFASNLWKAEQRVSAGHEAWSTIVISNIGFRDL